MGQKGQAAHYRYKYRRLQDAESQLPARSSTAAALYVGTTCFSFVLLSCLYLLSPSSYVTAQQWYPPSPYITVSHGSYWHGWHNTKQMIVFGDSWSSTGYELDGVRPSAESPLGNPAWPGAPATNGPNWIGYLTQGYNHSQLLTTNYAVKGSLIDPEDNRTQPTHMNTQVMTNFAQHDGTWTTNTSLFVFWIGVNDIISTMPETVDKFEHEFRIYATLLDFLYSSGARNFLFMNTVPLDRSPAALQAQPGTIWPTFVPAWNKNLTELVSNFNTEHTDASTFLFDAHSFFEDVMNEPCVTSQSCRFKTTNSSCDPYYDGTPQWNTHDPACPYSVDRYMWLNSFHLTTQMHNATAWAVAHALLAAGGG